MRKKIIEYCIPFVLFLVMNSDKIRIMIFHCIQINCFDELECCVPFVLFLFLIMNSDRTRNIIFCFVQIDSIGKMEYCIPLVLITAKEQCSYNNSIGILYSLF